MHSFPGKKEIMNYAPDYCMLYWKIIRRLQHVVFGWATVRFPRVTTLCMVESVRESERC